MARRGGAERRYRARGHGIDTALTRWLGAGAGLVVALEAHPMWKLILRADARLPGLAAGLERIGARYGLRPPEAPAAVARPQARPHSMGRGFSVD